MIKYIFYNSGYETQKKDYINLTINAIYRNFGGQEKSIKIMKDKFIETYNEIDNNIKELIKELELPDYNVFNCINDNLNSKIDSRYLMLIINNEIIENILYYLLKGKKYKILTEKDINDYNNENNGLFNLLLKIQIYMEQEIILILKNLEVIYPSLYELFNKSFSEYDEKEIKYTRISYENSQTLIRVNNKSRIIVLVDEEKKNDEDKPLLNRFEKHILSFDYVLDEESKKISKEIYDSYNDLIVFKYKENKIFLNYNLIYNDLEQIKFLVFNVINKYENNEYTKDELVNDILKKIIPIFNQEMICLLNYNKFIVDKIEYNKTLKDLYKENYKNNYNFETFLNNLKKEDLLNIIYTFSNKENPLFNNNRNINNKNNITFKPVELTIDNNSTINDFKDTINNFIKNDENNLLIIKFEEDIDNNHKLLTMSKTMIEEYINNNENINKIFIYIVYKKRIIIDNQKNSKKKYKIFQLFEFIFIL